MAARIMVAAQAFEQGVDLLQPGTGRGAVVGFGQAREFGQGFDAYRVQGQLGAHDGLFAWAPVAQPPQAPTQQGQQQQQCPPARGQRPPADRRRGDQGLQLIERVHEVFPGRCALRYSRSCSIISLWVLNGINTTRSFCASSSQRSMRASLCWR